LPDAPAGWSGQHCRCCCGEATHPARSNLWAQRKLFFVRLNAAHRFLISLPWVKSYDFADCVKALAV
jgi:hypothetical protein